MHESLELEVQEYEDEQFAPDAIIDRFRFDRIGLDGRQRGIIDSMARRIAESWRRGRPRSERINLVELVGHTDSSGRRSYNRGLGRARAANVAEVLAHRLRVWGPRILGHRARFMIRGVEIRIRTRGEDEPVASNRTPAGRARNRRVAAFLFASARA